jgi:hypothetical protein
MSDKTNDERASAKRHSRLFYYGTQIEVELGDRVRFKRWFRSDLEGIVCYIPGISPKHRELEHGNIKKWATRVPDGTVFATIYCPDRVQPKKNLVFVARSADPGINPKTPLL